jgi:hypothetical protein
MKNLVDAHLERIPGNVFVKFQESIKRLVSKQHGVYALYKGDKLYYVGLAKNLKSRIQQHLKDQHKSKWDMFSLFLIKHVEHLKELETLVVHIAHPKGNTQAGRFARSTNLKPKLKRLLEESVQTMFSSKVSRPSRSTKSSARRGHVSIERPLKGFLPRGSVIRSTYKGRQTEGQVDAEGRITINDKVFNSPSTAASSVTNRPMNGWTFWKFQDSDGNWVLLDTLRKKK